MRSLFLWQKLLLNIYLVNSLFLKVDILPKALEVIEAVADFVEEKNTQGSGKRFFENFLSAIEKLAIPNVEYAICHHHTLAFHKYSCSHFNDWVIAFKIDSNALTVYEIVYGANLA